MTNNMWREDDVPHKQTAVLMTQNGC